MPVLFYFYWQREPIASDFEIYLFSLPVFLPIIAFAIYAGSLLAILTIELVGTPAKILALLMICADYIFCKPENAERFEQTFYLRSRFKHWLGDDLT